MIIERQNSTPIRYVSDKYQYWILRDLDNSIVLFGDINEEESIDSGREVLELYDTFEEMRTKALEYGITQEEIGEIFPNDIEIENYES
jgi:hypothetical protein